MRSPLSKAFIIPVILGCTIWFSACGAKIPVGKYAALKDSSQSILNNTTDTYTRIEKLQRYFLVITAPDKPIDRDTFKPINDIVPRLRFRESAFEVLVKYVSVLYALSSKDYASDVDKASQELAGSLKNLMETSKKLSTSDGAQASAIFGTLVNVIGRQIVERKRLEALKTVMDFAQNDLEKLSGLIVGSNKKIKELIDPMLKSIIANANPIRPAYGSAGRYQFDLDIAERIAEVEEIESSLDLMNQAISKIPEAHLAIRMELYNMQPSMEALKALIGEADRSMKFYRDLSKK
ncbi:MAG: hypothetical protein KKD99_07485 [Proteobacteria bacterium]|nr:hypothetical protein [Pseudomonadota bacterium]MBU4357243.1 hypothetical protein [Pseudomonadota bacterium]MBU4448412.1 hypothetical protein [Pseudomonadota bacterium]MCG2771836.1 hypothetical protein [Desulfobacterales bacterium]